MPIHQHQCHVKSTWRFIVVSVAMAILIVGSLSLIFYFAAVKGLANTSTHPKAEPVWLGGKNGSTVVFPFAKNLWINMPHNGSCPERYFECSSAKSCLPLEKKCDSKVDCLDAEDELNCLCAFRLPASKFCDHYPDCFDESDEGFCSYCPVSQGREASFNCGDGKCIDRHRVCDSIVDCENFMDENFCFRLSSNVSVILNDKPEHPSSIYSQNLKSGFLLRNKNGVWYPVCANPYDNMPNVLASVACFSITANPLSSSSHQYRIFPNHPTLQNQSFTYHSQGAFVRTRSCLGATGMFITCDDTRCGFNPRHFLPKRSQGRIVGGELSQPGAWPWHAAIYKNGTYECGATLINNRWLISAAHCFLNYQLNYYEIQLGMLRRRSFTPHQKTYRIDVVVPHPSFNIAVLEYDIVMLRTSEIIIYDFWIRPICLPSPGRIESTGSFCTAIGWGDTGEKDDDSDDLLEVNVPLTQSCKRNRVRWLCAGYIEGGRDACQGDSGGPLMCMNEDRLSWYIAGVISAGTGCARPKTPGMYTRVAYFLDWIQFTMAKNGIDSIPPASECPGLLCPTVGGGNCLKQKLVCDGHVDCYDAEDETHCTKKT